MPAKNPVFTIAQGPSGLVHPRLSEWCRLSAYIWTIGRFRFGHFNADTTTRKNFRAMCCYAAACTIAASMMIGNTLLAGDHLQLIASIAPLWGVTVLVRYVLPALVNGELDDMPSNLNE